MIESRTMASNTSYGNDLFRYPAIEIGSSVESFEGVRTSTRIIAAHRSARGGDWCEIFALENGLIAVSIGDVCGHGPVAFDPMVAIRSMIRDAAYDGLDPAAVLTAANEFICARESELFATAIFGVLNAQLGTFTFVSAGHPPPLLAGAGGAKFLSSQHPDYPLGLAPIFLPRTVVTSVPMETLLVLYTDGVTEHERDVLRGEAQLFAAAIEIERDGSLPTATAIAEHMGLEDSNHDDAAILTAWIPYATSRARVR